MCFTGTSTVAKVVVMTWRATYDSGHDGLTQRGAKNVRTPERFRDFLDDCSSASTFKTCYLRCPNLIELALLHDEPGQNITTTASIMEESGASLGCKEENEGQGGLLAFFYGDALVKSVEHHEDTIMQETVRLVYKEVRGGIVREVGKIYQL